MINLRVLVSLTRLKRSVFWFYKFFKEGLVKVVVQGSLLRLMLRSVE